MASNVLTIADLFCGASGLGLGARQAGFKVAASIDIDRILTSSYAANFIDGHLHLGDISDLSGRHLIEIAGGPLDGIIGGPPCQGFSEVGKGNLADPRRDLLAHFFRVVSEARPKFFLMENVRGLLFSKNREFLERSLDPVRLHYELVGPLKIDASEFGAATSRPRVFVFGYLKEYVGAFTEADIAKAKSPSSNVSDAIRDLAEATYEHDEDGYDWWRFTNRTTRPSAYARKLRTHTGYLSSHRRTPHKPEIADRFALVEPGSMDRVGRHHRLEWLALCPTLRAGTGAERGSFQAVRPLHPEEPRVITVREAARLQGFPDWFRFHPTIWHSFRMIGNSVSPIAATALLSAIHRRMV